MDFSQETPKSPVGGVMFSRQAPNHLQRRYRDTLRCFSRSCWAGRFLAAAHLCWQMTLYGQSVKMVHQWYTFIRLEIIWKKCMLLSYSILFTVICPIISVPYNQCKVKTEEIWEAWTVILTVLIWKFNTDFKMHFATYCTEMPKRIYLNLNVQIRLHFSGRALGLHNSRKSMLNVVMAMWLTINTSCTAILMTVNVSTYCAALPGMIQFIFDIKTNVLKGENVKIHTSFQPHRCRCTAADSALITQSQYILRIKKEHNSVVVWRRPDS